MDQLGVPDPAGARAGESGVMDIRRSQEYVLIHEFYGDRRAQRSGVPLINHIDEGLEILRYIGASDAAMKAYCLHPLFQGDAELAAHAGLAEVLDPYVLMLAMEYRRVANAYLSHRAIGDISEIRLSPLAEVNQMLAADKIQNFKDFMVYHCATHPCADALFVYFRNWFDRLGIPRAVFDALAQPCPPAMARKQTGPKL